MEPRLTTILDADVVGYSRLLGADEAGTFAALKGHGITQSEGKVMQTRQTLGTARFSLWLLFPVPATSDSRLEWPQLRTFRSPRWTSAFAE